MLVRATCIWVVLRAHSVRGEPRIQRNASGEVATTSTPFSTNRTDRAFFCEGFTQHDLHILIKPERLVRKASYCSSKQQ